MQSRPGGSFQSDQPPLSLVNIRIVPLNISSLLKPAPQIAGTDLTYIRISNRGIFELACSDFQLRFIKISAAPEHQPDAMLELAVAHDWITFQKPDRMTVPDFVFGFGQMPANFKGQPVTECCLFRIKRLVVFSNFRIHG